MTMEPAIDLPAVEYAERSASWPRCEQQVNEDACGHRETRLGHLCVVCDGMGGHAAGSQAAELALATIFEAFDEALEGASPASVLRKAIEEASRRVHAMRSHRGRARPAGIDRGGRPDARARNRGGALGDSRAYLVHEETFSRVTRDHSVVQEMVNRGPLGTLEQAAQHPDANRITRALGMAPIEAEVRPQPIEHVTGDAFVLCSDGLSDLVEDAESSGWSTACRPRRPREARGHRQRPRRPRQHHGPGPAGANERNPVVGGRRAHRRADAGDAGGRPDGRVRSDDRRASRRGQAPTEVPMARPLEVTPTSDRDATSAGTGRRRHVGRNRARAARRGAAGRVLATLFVERRGTHKTSNRPDSSSSSNQAGPALEGQPGRAVRPDDARPQAPATLVPQKVELPVQSAAPIAPLEPCPNPQPSLHRKRKPKEDAVE